MDKKDKPKLRIRYDRGYKSGMICIAAFTVFYLCAWPSSSAAQVDTAQKTSSVIVFRPGGTVELPESVKKQALTALQTAVLAGGWRELSNKSADNCSQGSCVNDHLASASADLAIISALWAGEDRLSVDNVVVTIVDKSKSDYSSGPVVVKASEVGLESAMRKAFFMAQARYASGLKGQPIAPAKSSEEKHLIDSSSEAAKDQVSPWNYILGGGLAGLGVFLLASTIHTAAVDGDCQTREPDGFCSKEASFMPLGLIAAGGAALSLAGAGYFFIKQPIRTSITTTSTSTMLTIKGVF